MFTQFSSFFSDALNSSSGHLKLCNSCHTDIHKYEGIRQGDTWTFEERGVPSLFSCDGMCSSYPNTIVLNQVLDVDTSLCPCLSIRDWMVPSDLKDMYLQVPIHPICSDFFSSVSGPNLFQQQWISSVLYQGPGCPVQSLPFELLTAPQVFT